MSIFKAEIKHLETVKEIVHKTINEIYPLYYPQGAVEFLIYLHNEDRLRMDIEQGIVYLIEYSNIVVGTVTIFNSEIRRLVVKTEYQGSGYGRQLMNFAERQIAKKYDRITVHATLSSKAMFLKHGYIISDCRNILTDKGEYFCSDIMSKVIAPKSLEHGKLSYDGRRFVTMSNSENGEINAKTVFHYHQYGNFVWAEYFGGKIEKGFIVGVADENSCLEISYQHINDEGILRIGKCQSTPIIQKNGKLIMQENWKWLNGDIDEGYAELMEI